jgi:hypothetical protein
VVILTAAAAAAAVNVVVVADDTRVERLRGTEGVTVRHAMAIPQFAEIFKLEEIIHLRLMIASKS